MNKANVSKYDLNKYCAVIAAEFPFADELNSMARQASAERAKFHECAGSWQLLVKGESIANLANEKPQFQVRGLQINKTPVILEGMEYRDNLLSPDFLEQG